MLRRLQRFARCHGAIQCEDSRLPVRSARRQALGDIIMMGHVRNRDLRRPQRAAFLHRHQTAVKETRGMVSPEARPPNPESPERRSGKEVRVPISPWPRPSLRQATGAEFLDPAAEAGSVQLVGRYARARGRGRGHAGGLSRA